MCTGSNGKCSHLKYTTTSGYVQVLFPWLLSVPSLIGLLASVDVQQQKLTHFSLSLIPQCTTWVTPARPLEQTPLCVDCEPVTSPFITVLRHLVQQDLSYSLQCHTQFTVIAVSHKVHGHCSITQSARLLTVSHQVHGYCSVTQSARLLQSRKMHGYGSVTQGARLLAYNVTQSVWFLQPHKVHGYGSVTQSARLLAHNVTQSVRLLAYNVTQSARLLAYKVT